MTPTLLTDLLDDAAAAWPDAPAVSADGTTLSFRRVAAASTAIAARLGPVRGQRVVLAASSRLFTVAALWGVARAGGVFVVVHEQTRGAALDHILDDAEPALVITDDTGAFQAAAGRGIRVLHPDELAGALTSDHSPDYSPPPVLAVDPTCMIYTSGSTALPKAVVSTHAAMVFAVGAIQSQLRYRPDDIVYCPLPLSFDYGMYQLFLGAACGAQVRLGRPAEVGPGLLRNLRDSGATVLAAVPAVSEALARLLRRAGDAQLPLRLLTNTGATLPAATVAALRERLPGLTVQLMFGLTECKRAAIMPPDGDLEHPGACGTALPGTEIRILDDGGDPLPPGEIGQIAVRGPHVMSGYWRRPELTEQRFPRRDGLFPELLTGDYGRLDADGYLYFSGRRDDLYKERGFRVSATEIEAAARRLPEVESAAVLPPAGDRRATLVVVSALSADQVVARLRDGLEEFKIPPLCRVVRALPLSGNGKVDKQALLREVVDA